MAIQHERHYTQDLLKPIEPHYDDLAFTTDNEGLVIHVDLYNGTETASVGGSVAGAVICPDGSTVALVGTSSGNTATVAVNSDCVAITGQITVNIQIVTGTIKTTVFTGKYNVLPFETNNPVDPGSRVTLAIGDLIEDIDEAKTVLDSLSIATVAETQSYLGL
jgi:hypothetical protein